MIRYADSFSMYDTANMGLAWDVLRDGYLGPPTIVNGELRIPSDSSGGSAQVEKIFAAQNTWIISMHFRNSGGGGYTGIVYARDGATAQWLFWVYGTVLKFCKGDGTLLASVDLQSSDAFLQVKVKIGSTDGTVDVLLNGSSVMSNTGLNTQMTANATADTIGFGHPINRGGNGYLYVKDLVIMDTQGTTNNDLFEGVLHVKGAVAASDGDTTLTPSTGTDHYACVNSIPPNPAEYVSGVSGTELFGMGSDPFTEEAVYLKGVLVKACAIGETEATSAKFVAKSGATLGESAAKTIQPTVYKYHTAAFETDPATGLAWSRAAAVGAQFGVEVV